MPRGGLKEVSREMGGRELGNGQREGTRQVCLSFLEGISYFAEVPRAPQIVLSQYLLDKRVDF